MEKLASTPFGIFVDKASEHYYTSVEIGFIAKYPKYSRYEETQDLSDILQRLCQEIVDLKTEVTKLKGIDQRVNEIYFAPGMPGAIAAKTSFNKLKRRSI